MQKYKATGNLTLFDEEERQQRLSKIGNPLGSLSAVFSACQGGDKVPDAKTIWLFREKLVKSGASEVLFQKFVDFLNKKQLG